VKTYAWIASLLFWVVTSSAQPLANDWIDYSADQRYLKFNVTQDGLHRIDYNALNFALQQLGEDIADVNPQSIQIWGRGEELSLHVIGEGDGSFDNNDAILFYAQRNDGWADEVMYGSNAEQTNPYYSLYSDTATYFLTWDPDGVNAGQRFSAVNFNTPASTPAPYLWQSLVRFYNDSYQKGQDLGGGKPITTYTGGKGWMSGLIGYNNGSTRTLSDITFNTPQAQNGAGFPSPNLEVALAGMNLGAGGNQAHHAQVQVNNGSGFTAVSDVFFGSYEYIRDLSSVPVSLGNTTTFRVAVNTTVSPLHTASDYSACAFVRLEYPRATNMSGQASFVGEVPQSASTTYLSVTNAGSQAISNVYDIEQGKRYVTSNNGGSFQCNIDPGDRRLLVWASSAATVVVGSSNLRPVGGDGRFEDPAQWEAEDAFIIISHRKIWTEAERYRNFRNSNFNPVLVDVELLYDQFSYGIRKHPLAIRNFADYALTAWSSEPKHLFLLGKSIEEPRIRKNSALKANNLVPCMGFPVSDIMLTGGLNGEKSHVPAIPTGRLAARTNEEVAIYLDKVREFENAQNIQITPYSINNRQWQKHILHFAGGDNATENTRFRGYLAGYQEQAEDSLFGGKVFLFSKTSGNVIEELNTDSVRLLLQEGPAVMTFFGHASGNTFDLSVDDPSLWNNRGKYPFVIANSCFSGNIHLPVESIPSISEQYLFTPSEGAIAFIATPDLSYENYLNTYTTELYRQFSRKNYGESFSTQMQATCDRMPNDERNKGVALEMTMHGDPSLMLYPHDKTEISINDPQLGADLRFIPSNITTDRDSFSIEVTLSNLGRSTSKVFNLTATRSFPNGSDPVIITKQIDGIDYEKTIRFTFAVDGENGIGENEIRIEADLPLSVVEEEIENTNNLIEQASFFISSSEIFPVIPYDFAVVPSLDVQLKANTGFPFLGNTRYLIELDTTDTYDSPFKKQTTIQQSAAVIEWDPQLANSGLPDSTVFFWRVTPESEPDKWREFSFQYIPDAIGWGQDHFFQYKNNRFDLLDFNRSQRVFNFPEASRELFVQVLGNPAVSEFDDNYYTLDGQSAPLGEYGIASIRPGFAVVVIDSTELRPWGTYGVGTNGTYENQEHRYGNNNDGDAHRRRVEYFFTFDTSDVQMASMRDMIEQHVEDGHYLLFYTQRWGHFETPSVWSENMLDFFELLGADSIRLVPDRNPYIFFVKKGAPETARQVIGEEEKSLIRLNTKVFSNFRLGSMEGPDIGPGMAWDSFIFKQSAQENNSDDIVQATVRQLTRDGLAEAFDSLDASGSLSLTGISASTYPYVELDFYTEDNTTLTPAQLRSWHILYDPAPDAALNPIRGSTITPGEEVVAGVEYAIGIAIENISEFDFGAFRVHYWVNDVEGERIMDTWLDYDALTAGEVLFDSVRLTTTNLSGRYFGYIEVNPKDASWHPEQYHFNNRAYFNFDVLADEKNPILDVTFDGVHILSGDIVSPQPEVVMELKDENAFLLMEDTTTFDVFLTLPSGQESRIPYYQNGQEIMFFEPASNEQNKARLTYRPQEPLADGSYTLKVMGRDATGNESGNEAYRIEFEVINESTVTHVMNYPNPFTTSTQFVFTLTGSAVPDVFTIQILTVTGKVVREITRQELGDIHIGRNITDYAWDGRDEFGDRLANGVYMYRVIMKINGETVERRNSGADEYFTKEFGKMYLFR
jgi:hypothetical protein